MAVTVLLTVSGCPMRIEIIDRVTRAVRAVPGVTAVAVELGVMSDEQRTALRESLRGPTREIVFNRAGNLTRIYAVASGKGGVGKSSITVNLATALAARGLSVGLLDADIYGHSVPRMLGLDRPPTVVDGMLLPPEANGVRAISMLPFKPGGTAEPVAFRGPMLHRALEQFLTDVWWGDLDILLLDLPPGTGDVAISSAQLLPERGAARGHHPAEGGGRGRGAGGDAGQADQAEGRRRHREHERVRLPALRRADRHVRLGRGRHRRRDLDPGARRHVPLLGRVPFDTRLREGGDDGHPLVVTEPDSAAGSAIIRMAAELAERKRGLAGMSLGVTPAGR